MSKMVLGAYTFAHNPSDMGLITPERRTAAVETYTSLAFFSWGADLVGKGLALYWPRMTVAQYDELQTLLAADATLVFTPQDGSAKSFNVELLRLDGRFHILLSEGYRKEVTLDLLILSEAS
jgi:hypothetical protein